MSATSLSLPPGTKLGAYVLEELLGQGGMGQVYRARDTRLQRVVAIKTLPAGVSGDPDRLARFAREARLASGLSHPNIVVVYDIGEADHIHYIAMEYVEGDTLAAKTRPGGLPPATVVELATQITDALAKAHASGVIHRDLKPSNIVVTSQGRVKLLDFGLSKLVVDESENASTLFRGADTTPGVLIGTAAYMSPEQAAARTVDARSDQFSFGVILYELLTGQHPFKRETSVQTMSAIIEAEADPIGGLNPKVPEALAHIVERCLAKDPQQRFESTGDLAIAMQNISDHLRSGRTLAPVTRRERGRGLRWWFAAATLVTALAVGGMVGRLWSATGSSAPTPKHVAVLPLTPIGGASELTLLSEGLAEVLTTRLIELERFTGSLRIVPASEIRREQIASAHDAHRAFGVTLVVSGSVQRAGDTVRLTLNVIDAQTRRIVSAEAVDATMQQMPALQDDIVLRVARLLGVDVGPQARSELSAGSTQAPGAFEYYVQSRAYLQRAERPENVDAALDLLTRALTEDPKFALAQAALAEAAWRKFELTRDSAWVNRAKSAAAAAVDLSPQLPQTRVTLAMIDVGTGRYETAIQTLNQLLAEDPTNAAAYRQLSLAYEALNKFDDAERTLESAIRARPDDWLAYNQLGSYFNRRRNYAAAAVQFQRVVALTPDNARGHSNLGGMYVQLGRYDEAIVSLERAVALNPASPALPNLGTIYFRQGRYNDAALTFERAIKTRPRDYRIWRNLGAAYRRVPGRDSQATETFRRAAELAEEERKINPRQPLLLAELADCYANTNDRERAVTLIAQAETLAPADGNISLLAAQVFEQLGDRKQALLRVEAAVRNGVTRDQVSRTRSLDALRQDPAYRGEP